MLDFVHYHQSPETFQGQPRVGQSLDVGWILEVEVVEPFVAGEEA
jgi:hypothetical protein